jgi:hypothetical protein
MSNGVFDPIETASLPTTPPNLETGVFILPSPSYPITKSAECIFAAIATERRLFLRGGKIVEVEERNDGNQLAPISPEAFQSRIETYGRKLMAWCVHDGKRVLRESRCSVATARALMEAEPVELLPSIATVTSCPVIDPEGNVLGPGYHEHAGGIYVASGRDPEEVPLEDAVRDLWELIADFDFLTPGDRARAMAAFITPALRMGRLIPGRGFAPIDVAEATESQSGKGYRHDLVLATYGERRYQTAERKGGVGSLDESLSCALFSGRPFVLIDNQRGSISSPFLESFMTTNGRMAVRVPRMAEVEVDGQGVTVQVSSNGFDATIDFVNRASFVRIRKRPADYRFRSYPEGRVLEHVKGRQPHFLGCVFAVVREWLRRQRPQTGETRHDFREWVGSLDFIVGDIMGAGTGVMMDGHQDAAKRVANPSLTWLRKVGLACMKRGQPSREWATCELGELADEEGIPAPGIRLGTETEAKLAGRILRRAFGNHDSVTIDDLRVQRVTRQERVETSGAYRDRHFFRFESVAVNDAETQHAGPTIRERPAYDAV